LKRKDEVIDALFQQIDALTDRIASAEAAICRLQGQKQDMFQAIRKRQQVIEDQTLYIQELRAVLDQARPAAKRHRIISYVDHRGVRARSR
jgi:predicted  nucleic acid-binding Zn-ribbon protein